MDSEKRKKRSANLALLLRAVRTLVFAVLAFKIGVWVWKAAPWERIELPRETPAPAVEEEPVQEEPPPPEVFPEPVRTVELRDIRRPSYMIYYGVVDDAVIEEAKKYDIVILYPRPGELTREKVWRIQNGGTYVLSYLSVGEDLRTNGMTPEEMLQDGRFVKDGTGPRVDPRAPGTKSLDELDPLGLPSPGGTGFASYYLDDNDHDGLPDFNQSFRCAYTNIGDPSWFDALNSMTLDGEDGVFGIREILTDSYGRGLGCDGLLLDTIDTCAPNEYTGDQDPNRTRFEWTAPGVVRFMERLKAEYPDKYLLQNRGLFFYNYQFPHYAFSPRKYIDFLMFESYMLDSNPDELYQQAYFEGNKYMYRPKILAEANRPDGFQILSLGYAEGPEEYRLKETLLGNAEEGLDILLEDMRQAEDESGFSHYITDRDLMLPNHFVLDHRETRDDAPPCWTSVHNLAGVYPYEPPVPRTGIGEAEPVKGGVIVRWDVAMDKNGVDYTLYYQKAPFDFEGNPDLTGAESLPLVPDIGEGYAYQAPPESYPYQTLVEGLDPGETYHFVIRAKDRSPERNEEKNTVTVTAVPR